MAAEGMQFSWLLSRSTITANLALIWEISDQRFGGNGGEDENESPETSKRPLGYSSGRLQSLLCVAGIGCCTAMAMPQVHIIAYAVDLGYSALIKIIE